jgi:hypothetical protein
MKYFGDQVLERESSTGRSSWSAMRESLADRGGAPQPPSQGAAPTNTAEKNASIAVRLETAVG